MDIEVSKETWEKFNKLIEQEPKENEALIKLIKSEDVFVKDEDDKIS